MVAQFARYLGTNEMNQCSLRSSASVLHVPCLVDSSEKVRLEQNSRKQEKYWRREWERDSEKVSLSHHNNLFRRRCACYLLCIQFVCHVHLTKIHCDTFFVGLSAAVKMDCENGHTGFELGLCWPFQTQINTNETWHLFATNILSHDLAAYANKKLQLQKKRKENLFLVIFPAQMLQHFPGFDTTIGFKPPVKIPNLKNLIKTERKTFMKKAGNWSRLKQC